jgi:hypothetical protein
VISLVLWGSVVFAAPSSNATISLVFIIGILLIGRHLHKVALERPEPFRTMISVIYFIIPHLEWFDIRDLVIHNKGLLGWVDCALASLYAAAYTGFFLFSTWLLFRRKALN